MKIMTTMTIENTIRTTYHWAIAVFPILGLAYIIGIIIWMLICGGNATSVLWHMAMAFAIYHFMLMPGLRELREFRKEAKE